MRMPKYISYQIKCLINLISSQVILERTSPVCP